MRTLNIKKQLLLTIKKCHDLVQLNTKTTEVKDHTRYSFLSILDDIELHEKERGTEELERVILCNMHIGLDKTVLNMTNIRRCVELFIQDEDKVPEQKRAVMKLRNKKIRQFLTKVPRFLKGYGIDIDAYDKKRYAELNEKLLTKEDRESVYDTHTEEATEETPLTTTTEEMNMTTNVLESVVLASDVESVLELLEHGYRAPIRTKVASQVIDNLEKLGTYVCTYEHTDGYTYLYSLHQVSEMVDKVTDKVNEYEFFYVNDRVFNFTINTINRTGNWELDDVDSLVMHKYLIQDACHSYKNSFGFEECEHIYFNEVTGGRVYYWNDSSYPRTNW